MRFPTSGVSLLRSAICFTVLLVCSAARATTDPSLNLTLTKTNQSIVLSWLGANAVPYQLESSSNLTAWANVGTPITGSNTFNFVTTSEAGTSRQFYRVSRLFPAANGTAAFNPVTGLLTIVGDDADNVITVGLNGNLIFVTFNGGAIPITGGVPATTNTALIQVLGRGGNDQITMANGLPPAHLFGDTGNDTLLGGSAAEVFVGGPGNDFVDGNQGIDIVYLGEGDDTFQWDPGDGSDIVEGGDGNDTLQFNGANISENIGVTAFGSRIHFTRDVAGITLDIDGVEKLNYLALGGADNVIVNNLAGTTVTQVNINLAAIGGAGDAAVDTVSINGTAGPDTFSISNNAGALEVSMLNTQMRVVGGELANDRLVLNGVGNDLVNVNGSALSDTMVFSPSPVLGYVRSTSTGFTIPVDISGVLTLSLNGLGGTDTISGSGNIAGLGIPIELDGGDGDDFISGSNAGELILGGLGNDVIDGNQGNDTVLMGGDNDTFIWDPGDGSDTIEGEGGTDILVFNTSNVSEIVDMSAVGSRLRLARNVGGIVMDVEGVERVDWQALGGADGLTVNSLAGTAVTLVNIELAGTVGGGAGDAQPDVITVNGTALPDTINLTASGGAVDITGLAAQLHITHSESANDSLVVNGLAGTDIFNLNPGVTSLIGVTLNQ